MYSTVGSCAVKFRVCSKDEGLSCIWDKICPSILLETLKFNDNVPQLYCTLSTVLQMCIVHTAHPQLYWWCALFVLQTFNFTTHSLCRVKLSGRQKSCPCTKLNSVRLRVPLRWLASNRMVMSAIFRLITLASDACHQIPFSRYHAAFGDP